MAASSYDEALRRVLEHEGGYSNDPGDPGGPTKYGITIFDARAYWKRDATAADMRAMPLTVAKRIYRDKYWNAMRCDELPAGVDYAVFDYGVNSGIGRAGRVLKRLIDVPAGIAAFTRANTFTDALVAAVNQQKPVRLITVLCDERMKFLQGLRTWSLFGRGWGRRVREVRAAALAMADQHAAPPPPAPKPQPQPEPAPAPAPPQPKPLPSPIAALRWLLARFARMRRR
jgi:lysozyme family protein